MVITGYELNAAIICWLVLVSCERHTSTVAVLIAAWFENEHVN